MIQRLTFSFIFIKLLLKANFLQRYKTCFLLKHSISIVHCAKNTALLNFFSFRSSISVTLLPVNWPSVFMRLLHVFLCVLLLGQICVLTLLSIFLSATHKPHTNYNKCNPNNLDRTVNNHNHLLLTNYVYILIKVYCLIS